MGFTKGRKSLESIQRNAEIAFKDGVDGRTVLENANGNAASSFEANAGERRTYFQQTISVGLAPDGEGGIV